MSPLQALKTERSIPAWAGEPGNMDACGYEIGVYPRVGGGTNDQSLHLIPPPGLSPRGRGNLHRAVRPNLSIRSIPAWAGEPRSSLHRRGVF